MADKTTNRKHVVSEWLQGRAAKSGAFRTNGISLYSYDHEIGYRGNAGVIVVRDCHYSETTAQHVNVAKPYADSVIPCPIH